MKKISFLLLANEAKEVSILNNRGVLDQKWVPDCLGLNWKPPWASVL
jgi:hypothetical protein